MYVLPVAMRVEEHFQESITSLSLDISQDVEDLTLIRTDLQQQARELLSKEIATICNS